MSILNFRARKPSPCKGFRLNSRARFLPSAWRFFSPMLSHLLPHLTSPEAKSFCIFLSFKVWKYAKGPSLGCVLLALLREKARIPRSPERALLSGDEWPYDSWGESTQEADGFCYRRTPCSRQRTSLVRTGFFTDLSGGSN